jgi:acetolactate synthase I/III small subunit
MAKHNKEDIHTISILVANKPGVLVRCAQVFARRAYNIDALVVSATMNPKYSRMTITAQGDPGTLDQIIKQTNKLIDVIHCYEHTGFDSIDREFALLKVKYTSQNKKNLLKLMKSYHAKISHDTDNTLIVGQAGTSNELDQFEEKLKKYGVIEMVRSGKIVMAKGTEVT